ncbi:MAG: AAA family ATPase [Chloroflexi bacterium]|nr:AAA family ATPase [Chloroflexota bacterium]
MNVKNRLRIEDIFIKNYRSFSPNGELVNGFSGINIFVGPNGVGKSVFFNAIRYCLDWNSFNAQGTYDLKRNFNDPKKSIEIIINVDAPQGKPSRSQLVQRPNTEMPVREPDPKAEPFFKQRTFPIGIPRKFPDFQKPTHPVQYKHICGNWKVIRQDAKKYMDITLPVKCPSKRNDDRIFFDIKDENGALLLEGSDGKANFLFMIFSIRKWEPGSVIFIEEPEVSMHPGLQKQFLSYLKELSQKENYQFLVSTHSPYLMNLAVTDEWDDISIFRLSKDAHGHTKIRLDEEHDQSWVILSDLGHSPADVLHANGIIWVEGPSDLIYLDVWIKKLASDLRRGKDYEIMWYGGSNFVQIGTEDEQKIRTIFWQNKETPQKLISLFSLNPNWAFIVDSDSDKESDRTAKARATFTTINEKKDAFIRECKAKGKYTWKVDPFIEECMQERGNRPKGKSKVEWAHEYKRDVMANNSFDDRLSSTARNKVEELISVIRKWH